MKSDKNQIQLANKLVGTPWHPVTNCWWLIREWYKLNGLAELPNIAVGIDSPENLKSIIRVCTAGGLRPVANKNPEPFDIVVLRNFGSGRRHVGTIIIADGRVHLLHSEGHVDFEATRIARKRNPSAIICKGPGVLCEELSTVLYRYYGMELWRRYAV